MSYLVEKNDPLVDMALNFARKAYSFNDLAYMVKAPEMYNNFHCRIEVIEDEIDSWYDRIEFFFTDKYTGEVFSYTYLLAEIFSLR